MVVDISHRLEKGTTGGSENCPRCLNSTVVQAREGRRLIICNLPLSPFLWKRVYVCEACDWISSSLPLAAVLTGHNEGPPPTVAHPIPVAIGMHENHWRQAIPESDIPCMNFVSPSPTRWELVKTLRGHLDAVRAVAFHPTEKCLATGSDDNTIRIWRIDMSHASSGTQPQTYLEPQLTFRGHKASITRLVYSPSKHLLYSAALDCQIRTWDLSVISRKSYAPVEETTSRNELVGHSEAIWGLALAPNEATLVSCGADRLVKAWDASTTFEEESLKLSWCYDGKLLQSIPEGGDISLPTAVEVLRSDPKTVAVALTAPAVKILNIENGKVVKELQIGVRRAENVSSVESTDATRRRIANEQAQISSLSSHPNLPLLAMGCEDGYIYIFNTISGECTKSLQAHWEGVTSLSIDASGSYLVSGSNDCVMKIWELRSFECTQQSSGHRKKAGEGVLDVRFHPSLPLIATAGADGLVRLYASPE